MKLMGTKDILRWLSAILQMLVAMATNTSGYTTNTQRNVYGNKLCPSNACRNGECYLVGSQPECACTGGLFKGDRCEDVNMDVVTHAIVGTIAVFQWPEPPRLKGYAFVYYEIQSSQNATEEVRLYKTEIVMKNNENSVLVSDLVSQRTLYRICIEDDHVADMALSRRSVQLLRNCVNVRTLPDYHSLAAWCLAFMLCCVAVLLIYFQKDKIELLYFHKPYIVMQLPKTPEAEEEVEVKPEKQEQNCNNIKSISLA